MTPHHTIDERVRIGHVHLKVADLARSLTFWQGVIVGKASVSDRPVIVRFHDQTREPADSPPRELPQPPREESAARQGPTVG